MNHIATSQEALLAVSLRLAAKQGLHALGMRDVAREAGVSVGCVYRYFPSKAELLAATVGAIWEGIFHQSGGCARPAGFRESVRWVFDCIRNGSAQYPSFFTMHAADFAPAERDAGRALMHRYQAHMLQGLLIALNEDAAVRAEAFDPQFTREAFVHFVFDQLMLLGMQHAASCDYLLTLITKLLY